MKKKPVYFLELPNMTKQFNVIEKLQSLRQHGKSKEGAEREQGRVAGGEQRESKGRARGAQGRAEQLERERAAGGGRADRTRCHFGAPRLGERERSPKLCQYLHHKKNLHN